MKNYILFVLFSVIFVVSLASATQPPKLQWVARYKGFGIGNGEGYPLALAIDDSGNVYVTGASEGSREPGTHGGRCRDYATVKYNSNGKELWVARYNGPANNEDTACAIAVDNLGNVYVTGGSRSNLEDETWRGLGYATIKYDSNGGQLWIKRYDGGGGATAMGLYNSVNIYVTGGKGTIKYKPNGEKVWTTKDSGVVLAIDESESIYVAGDGRVIKYKPNGDKVWVVKDYAQTLAIDHSHNVYALLWGVRPGTKYSYATSKYDPSGKRLWLIPYDVSTVGRGDNIKYLAIDGSSNVYVGGTCVGKDTNADYIIIKYGCNGNKLWVARYNGPANGRDIAGGMVVDDSGNVYLTGGSERFANSDETDVVTLKYDSNGKELWCVRYGGNFGYVQALAIDDSGNVYVTGAGGYRGGEYVTLKYAQHD